MALGEKTPKAKPKGATAQELHLGNNRLISLPKSFGELRKLKKLDLERNSSLGKNWIESFVFLIKEVLNAERPELGCSFLFSSPPTERCFSFRLEGFGVILQYCFFLKMIAYCGGCSGTS